MSNRTVKLVLEGKVDGLVNSFKTASKATKDFSRDLGAWRKANSQELDILGAAAGKSGAAIGAGLVLAGKAAVDWQSDWTGVLKTVEGTPAQLGKVEDGLRGLAKTLPSTHTEIAGVAEAAGQLGIATDDIVDFTKVMIDLGESTNMSAETAATQIARFSNVMGTSSDDAGRLGATLVGLGNNFATTESEIMDMSMRLAGAGKQIGLSEGQTMGLAAAMSSVGIEAEAGGSAMSLTMKRVSKAVDEGGSSLETFANVSGMTAEQFATLWKKDAAAGLEAFTVGLGEAGASGESVNAILTELGITGIRESDALLRLSSAGELMGNSMKQGASEFADGSALIEEATKRYETAESKIKMAWNGIKDAAITAGASLLPIISGLAEGVADLADWFGSLPAPVHTFLTVLAGIGAAAGLGIAAVIKVSDTLSDLRGAFNAIAPAESKARGALAKTATALGVLAAAYMAVSVAAAIASDARSKHDKPVTSNEISNALQGMTKDAEAASAALDEVFNGAVATGGAGGLGGAPTAVNDLSSALDRLFKTSSFDNFNDFLGTTIPGVESGSEVVRKAFTEMDTAVAGLASSGHAEDAAAGFKKVFDGATERGAEVKEIIDLFPAYRDAAYEALTANGETQASQERLLEVMLSGVPVTEEMAAALAATGDAGRNASGGTESASASIRGVAMSAEDAEKAVQTFYDALVAIGAVTLSERDALRGYEEAIDAAAEAATKNGKTLDRNTEKGRANEAALDAIADKTLSVVTAQEANGRSAGDLAATMEAGRESFIKQATAMGMGEKAANRLADEMNLIPESVFMEFETNAEGVTARVSELYDWVKAAPDGKIEVEENTPEVRLALEKLGLVVKELPDGTIEVSEKGAKETGDKIDGVAKKKREAPIDAKAITAAAEAALDHLARDRNATINTHYTESGKVGGQSGSGAKATVTRNAAMATGGPVFGPGTGTSDSIPALLSNGEHVWTAEEVRRLGGHNKVESLRSLAMQGKLPAFAKGGRVGAAEKKVKSTRRAYDLIDGKKANRLRKLAAKDQWEAAKAELAAVKKSSKASEAARKKAEAARKKAEKEEREKQSRLSEGRFDLRTEARRGTMLDAFTSGGGMSYVDKMFDASRNKDLSKKQRSAMRSLGYSTERQLMRLEKRAESVEKKIDKATAARDRLLSARDGARDQITGAFDLGSMTGQKDDFGYQKFVGKKGLLSYGKSLAAGAKTLSSKVKSLQKLGFNESMIDQVIDEWTNAGTFELADAMLSMNKAERGSFNKSFKDLGTYATRTGNSLTEAMAKGGLNAAETIVSTLKKEEKSVETAFYKLGKAGQKGFHRAWGIASPAKEAKKDVGHIIDGQVLGIKDQGHRFTDAMAGLYAAPAFSIPPSAEVARYAAQPAAQAVQIDYDKLAAAMSNVQLTSPAVSVDRTTAARIVQVGNQQVARNK